ncbi:MAG TPA: branched-chain amino acid ABC transporter permease [Jatrophihabitantaceae bacterium]|jgi:branched-chain amino acid transport system permease protein|nr:branched-chain amino acid ABC transporter permease [Jatrophihabitantaceae bacterium]
MRRLAHLWSASTLARHVVLLAIGVAFVIVLTATFSDFHDFQLATLGAYLCAIAGLTVLTGLNGQVSLGHAALMAIGAYTVALLQMHFSNAGTTGVWVLPVSLLAGAAVTAVAGAVVGVAAARLRGPYLAGATLALGVALPSITSHYTSVFKGDQGLFVPFDGPPASLGSTFTLEHWQSWLSLFAALLVLFFLANLKRSAVGRHMRAVRDDEIASALCGLSVPRIQIQAFAVSSAAAGLGGGVLAVVLQNASPGSFDLVLSLTLLSAAVIGGLGTLTGAVWGSIVVIYLGTFIRDRVNDLHLSAASTAKLHDNLPNAVYGLMLILVMLALPGGIQGLLRRLPVFGTHRSTPHTGGSA